MIRLPYHFSKTEIRAKLRTIIDTINFFVTLWE